jgi:ankyrin repeat protein
MKGAKVMATDAWGRTPLHRACATGSGRQRACQLLLAQGADVNARDSQGNTPLHAAARNREVGEGFLEFLLAKGADVNARNEQGETPLHLVPMTGRKDKHREVAAGFLLTHGADVNATDKSGRTPLHVAARSGQARVVEVLLAKGATDRKTKDGLLALHDAVLGEHKEVVTVFLTQASDKRPDVNLTRPSGDTPLHDAAKAGYNEIAQRLIHKGADVNAKNARGETPAQLALAQDPPGTVRLLRAKGAQVSSIQLAAYLGDLVKVKNCIEKGASVDTQDGSGLTALHAAAAAGQKEVAEFLLGTGASVQAASGADGLGTPLHYAAHGGSKDMAELLLSKGAPVDAGNSKGEAPLHLAAQMGHTDVCRLLLARQANVNLRAWNRRTALHYAADGGRKEVAELLLEKGADIDIDAGGRGGTPLLVAEWKIGFSSDTDLAAASRYREVTRFLLDKGADVSSEELLYWVVGDGETELAEILIKKGANVNSDVWGYAPSLEASWNGNPAALELLLTHGANPNTDDGGWSLLHYEVSGDIKMVKLLLDKGANPNNTVIPGGQSPLHRAAELGRKAAVELLLARGADPNLKDEDGRTPLSLAKEKGHKEIVEFLRQHRAKE